MACATTPSTFGTLTSISFIAEKHRDVENPGRAKGFEFLLDVCVATSCNHSISVIDYRGTTETAKVGPLADIKNFTDLYNKGGDSYVQSAQEGGEYFAAYQFQAISEEQPKKMLQSREGQIL